MKKVIKLTATDVALWREGKTGVRKDPNLIHAFIAFFANLFVKIDEKDYIDDKDIEKQVLG